jgi:hypothetical protein
MAEVFSVMKFYDTVHWLLSYCMHTDGQTVILIGLLQGCECVEN